LGVEVEAGRGEEGCVGGCEEAGEYDKCFFESWVMERVIEVGFD